MDNLEITNTSLVFASILVFISLFISYKEKLSLEKEIIIAIVRAIIQLSIIGYILKYIFEVDNNILTLLILIFMITNASLNANKRGEGIKNSFKISFIAISIGSLTTLSVLLLTKSLKFIPSQIVPVGGMVISNAMVAMGLSYKTMLQSFKDRSAAVETKLSLGASIYIASKDIIKDSIKTGMTPTIDRAKTLGIVSLPGMMSGLILAGVSPLYAIKYQIMVTFMLMSTTSIAAFISCYLAYKGFFNERKQLI